jgi:type IV secretion system protein VirD4
MLILTAGRSPIYGRQILYFKDPTFSARSKMLAPEKSDSIYFERYTPTDFAKGVNFADFMHNKGKSDEEAA